MVGETQPRPGSRAVEALEDVRQLVRRDARAVVTDLDADATARLAGGNRARGVEYAGYSFASVRVLG